MADAKRLCQAADRALAASDPVVALDHALQASAAAPSYAKCFGLIGRARVTLGHYEAALQAFESGARINPEHTRMCEWREKLRGLVSTQACSVCGAEASRPQCSMPCRLVQAAASLRAARVLSRAGPVAVEINGFLTPQECQGLIMAARSRMVPSGSFGAARTSHTCFLKEGENCQRGATAALLLKIVQLTRTPVERFERVQVTRYSPGQRFGLHHDAFDPATADGRGRLECPHSGGQRACTVLVYLNSIAAGAGGRTAFSPGGLWCAPQEGKALVFCPALACGAIDPLAMHEALPPTEEKWVSQIWIRQRRTANNAGLGTALEMPAPAPA